MSRGHRGTKRNKSLRSLARRKPHRTPQYRVLIVCEGAKTEPVYFNRFRIEQRLSPQLFRIVGGDECGAHPKSLVQYAKNKAREAKRDRFEYEHIWCVFDRDQHENIHEALLQARANGFGLAFSNPCFELWFLLHFQDQRAEVNRQTAVRELKEHLPDYTKSTDAYDILKPEQQDAIDRAEALRQQYVGARTIPPNPSTGVAELVVFLNRMSTEASSRGASAGPEARTATS